MDYSEKKPTIPGFYWVETEEGCEEIYKVCLVDESAGCWPKNSIFLHCLRFGNSWSIRVEKAHWIKRWAGPIEDNH